jgi:P4 family phage/plasmid primase-like protien
MAVEHAGIASNFLASMFGGSTASPVYISSLPNQDARDREPGERHLVTREFNLIEAFCKKWDRKDRALYFCTATIQPGVGKRSKETLSELNGLHVDIDFKDIVHSERAQNKLGQLMVAPSTVVHSGHGLHAYWLLKEALTATPENIEQIEALLRLLADHLGGDLACAEASRLMRLPGTHNTKNGKWTEVAVIFDGSARYDLPELADWLEVASPAILRKPTNDKGEAADNPWLAIDNRLGFKPPVDVEERLRTMVYQGAGDSGIHATQISISAALLNRGHSVDEVLDILLSATRAAAGPFGERWNWRREERAIRGMCETWSAKHPEIVEPKPSFDAAEPKVQKPEAAKEEGLQPQEDTKDQDPTKQTKQKSRKKVKRDTVPITIADGVVEIVRNDGDDLLLTGGELYLYHEGVWRPADAATEQRLRVLIQQGAEALGEGAKLSIVGAAWKRLVEHPGLYRADVPWDQAGLVALANGVLDLRTRAFRDWDPEHYLRRKLDVHYDRTRQAPMFLSFLGRLFADRTKSERESIIDLIQEFYGATLCIPLLKREQRRALILVGASRTGKTELARLIGRLVGKPIASPSIAELSERFGLAGFFDAVAWIRDDAVNEGDKLDPQRFKTIVTGEPIFIERKNRPAVRRELTIPVVLTANSLPTSRDASDAIFNRSLVVDTSSVIGESEAVEKQREIGVPPGTWLADFLFDREGPGILNWSLDGLDRLLKRGEFEIPKAVVASIRRFKEETNGVAEFARTMLVEAPETKIERTDLLCAFHGWWREECGDDVRLLGGRWLMPKLRAVCPWLVERKIMGTRYCCGVLLNQEGLDYWERQHEDAARNGRGSKGSATSTVGVNQSWNRKDDEETGGNETSGAPLF